MEPRRLVRLIFLFFLTFFMLWNRAVYADEQGGQNTNTTGGNEQVSCELNENQQKQMAQQAASEAEAAAKKLQEVADLIKKNFKDSNGVCHYLDTSWFWEDGEWSASERGYTSEDMQGAKKADEILGGSKTVQSIERANSGDLKNYTDWDFGKLRQRAYSSDQNNSNAQKCQEVMSQAEAAMGQSADDANSFFGHRNKAHQSLVLLSGKLDCSCEKDSEGNVKGTCKEDDFEKNSDVDGCKSVAMYQEELSGFCITCKLFASIIGTAQQISRNAFEASANSLCGILGIALMIYLAYMTLVTIASPEAQKLSKYLTSITIQGFKVALTVLILQNPTFLYQKLLSPILDGSIDFSIALTGEKGELISEKGAQYSDKFDQSSEYFSAKTAQSMVGAIDNFTDSAALMPAIGRALICRAWSDLGLKRAWMVPRFMMFVEGSIIYIFGLGILLAIGFYMLDCAVELGLVFALMTFFVACWPFKMTSGYTKIGWNMFLNSFFNFVMMSVIIVCITRLSSQALSVGNSIDELKNLVNSDSIDALDKAMDLGGLQMVMVVVCSLMCFKLPKESGRLANKFAGGAHVAMGGALGGMAAGLVTNAIGRTARVTGNVAAPGAKIAGNYIMDKTGMKDKVKGLTSKAKNAIGSIGIGSKAKMGAKGRDANANKLEDSPSGGFLPDK